MASNQSNLTRFSVLLLLTVLSACEPATTPQETVDLDNTTPDRDTDGFRPPGADERQVSDQKAERPQTIISLAARLSR